MLSGFFDGYVFSDADTLLFVLALGEFPDLRACLVVGENGSVRFFVCEAGMRLFHGGGRRLRRTTDAVGKSAVDHITVGSE